MFELKIVDTQIEAFFLTQITSERTSDSFTICRQKTHHIWQISESFINDARALFNETDWWGRFTDNNRRLDNLDKIQLYEDTLSFVRRNFQLKY